MDRRVTVVVPSHDDDPAHLEAAIASVVAQTLPPDQVEVIVVDDGSVRPDLLSCLATLGARGVTVVRQDNAGPAAARNAGIRRATGDYVLPLDADDLVSETFLAEALALLDAEPELRFCFSRIHCFGAVDEVKEPPVELRLPDFFAGNRIVCTGVFRRADWERVGGYDESLVVGFEDYEFWVRLLEADDVARRLPGATFHYRIRAGSRTAGQPDRVAQRATREAILLNNQDRLPDLLRAAWLDSDDRLERERALEAEVGRWRRRTRWLRVAFRRGRDE